MSDLLSVGHGLEAFLLALVIFGLLPGPLLRFLLAFYPKGDPRRAQIRGDFDGIKEYWKRPFFVAQSVELAFCEGLPQRVKRIDRKKLLAPLALLAVLVGMSVATSEVTNLLGHGLGLARVWRTVLGLCISGTTGTSLGVYVGKARRRVLAKEAAPS